MRKKREEEEMCLSLYCLGVSKDELQTLEWTRAVFGFCCSKGTNLLVALFTLESQDKSEGSRGIYQDGKTKKKLAKNIYFIFMFFSNLCFAPLWFNE